MRHDYRDRGQGGKLGHSNMTHWTGTEEIKKEAKKARRLAAKKVIRVELDGIQAKGEFNV